MNDRPISLARSGFLVVSILGGALLGDCRSAQAQTLSPPPNPAVAAVTEVRQTIDTAWKEMQAFRTGGGKPAAPDHPALKWDAKLWQYRERHPGGEAAARATAEAIRLLVRGEFWEQAHARTDSVGFDDAAWERIPIAVYEEGSTRKDFNGTIAKLSQVAAGTASASIKSAALLYVGRAQRRQGDVAAATKSFEASQSAAPGSASAEEAGGLLYEIAHLSVGLPAPAFSA